MQGGDYARRRIIYQDVSMDRNFAASDGNLTLIAGKANYILHIQRVILTPSTSAAQAMTFQDSNTSPVYVAKIASSPTVDVRIEFDFGPEGKTLTSGKDFVLAMTAGNAGHLEVLAFMTPDIQSYRG